jgi:two-component system, OmpR family, phosphate regulon sensor histidine kinase PhoR
MDVSDMDVPMEKVNLYAVAQTCVDMLQIHAEKHEVKLKLEGSICYVTANKEMMEEVIYNLCDNAIRYNNPGGTVLIKIAREGNHVVVRVKDTGIGISKEHQERIFERFYRVDRSRSKRSGGTGLGLAIVKHIVSQHHAKLELESEKGVGTEIKIIF